MRKSLPVSGGAVEALPREVPRQGLGDLLNSERVLGPIMLAPAVLYIALLVAGPLVFAIYLSMSNATTGSQTLEFVGPANFLRAAQSPIFHRALMNTFIFTVISQVLVIIFGNITAL